MSKNQSSSQGNGSKDDYHVVCREDEPMGFVMDKSDANSFAYGKMGGAATGTSVEKHSHSSSTTKGGSTGGGSSGKSSSTSKK